LKRVLLSVCGIFMILVSASMVSGAIDIVNAQTGDNTPPVITINAPSIVEATSPQGAVVTYTATATDDVDGPVTPDCTPASGSIFPFGITLIDCIAFDNSGNIGMESSIVFVHDTMPPQIQVTNPAPVPATGPDGAVVTFTVTATDVVDGPVTPICTPASGSTFPVGTTQVLCTATDDSGNSASATVAVTVTPQPAPPTISIGSAIDGNGKSVPNGGTTTSNVITFTFQASGGTPPYTFRCLLGPTGFVEPCSNPKTYENLNEGGHTFDVEVRDATGQVAIAHYSWQIVPIPTLPPPDSACASTGGGNSVITGTNGADTLIGTNGNNIMNGLAGNDAMNGCSGNDQMNGGANNDGMAGSAGNDNMHGNDGNDNVQGGPGNDVIAGDGGVNTLTGGQGNDVFLCGPNGDTITDFQPGQDTRSGNCIFGPAPGSLAASTADSIATTPSTLISLPTS
jgi:hypothetical protein